MRSVKSNIEGREEPDSSAPPSLLCSSRTARRLWINFLADQVVRLGGLLVLLAILAVFLVILLEVLPLLKPPSFNSERSVSQVSGHDIVSAFFEPAGKVAYFSKSKEGLNFSTETKVEALVNLPQPSDAEEQVVIFAVGSTPGEIFIATNKGKLYPALISSKNSFPGSESELKIEQAFDLGLSEGVQLKKLSIVRIKQKLLAAVIIQSPDSSVLQVGLFSSVHGKGLVNQNSRKERYVTVQLVSNEVPTDIELSPNGRTLVVGTKSGNLYYFEIGNPENIKLAYSTTPATEQTAITALSFLLGGDTLIAGTEKGEVFAWRVVRDRQSNKEELKAIYKFESHSGAVSTIAYSPRNRTFATADNLGEVNLHYGTSGVTLLSKSMKKEKIVEILFAPKGDGLLLRGLSGELNYLGINNPHPEASLKTLFGKVWYEGYDRPEYVWQSSSGSDEFEPKISLIPLVYGTLKCTLYSLLLAVPLAILAAMYTAEFVRPKIRAYVKPIVELMAALPSVVIGFVAGLWLAPVLEPLVPGLAVFPVVLSLVTIATLMIWKFLPTLGFSRRNKGVGSEVFIMIPAVLFAGWLSLKLGKAVEEIYFAGSYQSWFLNHLGVGFDQRNCIVVAIAMGFAVIPLIFTIAEDSLTAVPRHLRAASLALGANRWQTAVTVVFPAALPGIFSAVMLGFGRAIGETMIVLMATGNTPLIDFSIFSGFRALSANIAVELPEAAIDGTLYRVLFLAALLLFVMTFVVNTFTEVIRIRLRKRYSQL